MKPEVIKDQVRNVAQTGIIAEFLREWDQAANAEVPHPANRMVTMQRLWL